MQRIALLIICWLIAIPSALALDPGTVQGTLQVGGKPVTLRYAYAHMHDNAEGVLDRPRELRILLADNETPQAALAGIVFLPVEELARQGALQGLLLKLDPAKPDNITITVLAQPARADVSLVTQTTSTPGTPVIKDFKLGGERVLGAIEQREERSRDPDLPTVAFALKFSAPVFKEPAVTADLKGKDAISSPQAQVFATRARAFTRGDFATVKKLSTQRANIELDQMLKQPAAQVAAMAKQAGAEMEKQARLIQRVVVRGERSVIVFPKNDGWSNFAREGGEWKSDD